MLKLQIAAGFTLWKHVNTEHVKRQHYSSLKSFKMIQNPAHWFWKIYQIRERVSHKLQIDYEDRAGKQTHCGRLSRNSRNFKCLVIKKNTKGKKKRSKTFACLRDALRGSTAETSLKQHPHFPTSPACPLPPIITESFLNCQIELSRGHLFNKYIILKWKEWVSPPTPL